MKFEVKFTFYKIYRDHWNLYERKVLNMDGVPENCLLIKPRRVSHNLPCYASKELGLLLARETGGLLSVQL